MVQWFSWVVLLLISPDVTESSRWAHGRLAGPGWPGFPHQCGLDSLGAVAGMAVLSAHDLSRPGGGWPGFLT